MASVDERLEERTEKMPDNQLEDDGGGRKFKEWEITRERARERRTSLNLKQIKTIQPELDPAQVREAAYDDPEKKEGHVGLKEKEVQEANKRNEGQVKGLSEVRGKEKSQKGNPPLSWLPSVRQLFDDMISSEEEYTEDIQQLLELFISPLEDESHPVIAEPCIAVFLRTFFVYL